MANGSIAAVDKVVVGLVTGRGASRVGVGGPGKASRVVVVVVAVVSWGGDSLGVKGLPPFEISKGKGLFADEGGGEGGLGRVLSDRVGVGVGLVAKEVCRGGRVGSFPSYVRGCSFVGGIVIVVMRVTVTRGGSDGEVWSSVLWQWWSPWEATCVHVLERMCALVACHCFFFL